MIRKHYPAAARPGGILSKLLGAALVAASCAAPAYAGVIDFEGYIGPVGGGEAWQQGGYDIGFFANVAGGGVGTLVGAFMNNDADPEGCVGMACPVGHSGTYYAALNDSYIDIVSSTPGNLFKIAGFDASFIGSSPVLSSYPAISGILRIQGILENGGYLIQDYLLDGPTAGGFTFGHYNTAGAFADTAFVEALIYGYVCNAQGSCSAFNSNRAQFAIDNLVLTDVVTAAVPEPSTSLIFGLGLFGLAAAARRRQA